MEIGAGHTSEIHHLIEHCSELVLIDSDKQKLDSSKALHEGLHVTKKISSLDTTAGADWPPEKFDFILLSAPSRGAIPYSSLAGNRLYDDLLTACHRLLSPGGYLVLFARNRHCIKDRPLARLLFNTELSNAAHVRALTRAGFCSVSPYALHYANDFVSKCTPLPPLTPTAGLLATTPDESLGMQVRQRMMSPRTLFIATKSPDAGPSTMQRIVDAASHFEPDGLKSEAPVTRECHLTRKGKCVLRLAGPQQERIVKIALSDNARQAELNGQRTLEWLSQFSSEIFHFPRAVESETLDGQHYFTETGVPGRAMREELNSENRDQYLEEVLALLTQLRDWGAEGRVFSTAPLNGELYDRLVTQRINKLDTALQDRELRSHLSTFFDRELADVHLPVGLLHGDFSVSNILVLNDRISGLIDWETSSLEDIPMLDSINYLDSVIRLFNPGALINTTIPALANGNLLTMAEKDFLRKSFILYDMDPALFRPLVYLRWLRHIAYLMDFWLYRDENAQQGYIYNIAATL